MIDFNKYNSIYFYLFFQSIDARVDRDGDRISLNIDLRLADIQNVKQQQQQQQHQHMPDHPPWSTFDPLERHIRKMERNIDQVRLIITSTITNISYIIVFTNNKSTPTKSDNTKYRC